MEPKTNWKKKTVLVNKSVLFLVEVRVAILCVSPFTALDENIPGTWVSNEIETNTSPLKYISWDWPITPQKESAS